MGDKGIKEGGALGVKVGEGGGVFFEDNKEFDDLNRFFVKVIVILCAYNIHVMM